VDQRFCCWVSGSRSALKKLALVNHPVETIGLAGSIVLFHPGGFSISHPSFCRLTVAKCIFLNALNPPMLLLEPANSVFRPLANLTMMCLMCYVRFLFDFVFLNVKLEPCG
jgi:hypothetical protein